jgi:hypothetical protein
MPGSAVRKFLDNVVIKDAHVVFKNFRGEEGQYNAAGNRNFGVLLDDLLAEEMEDLGWNVKRLKPREDEDNHRQAWIPVSIGFGKGRPPKIMMITSQGKQELSEDLVESLDWVDWARCDLILRPYSWNVNGLAGVKAYVKTIAVTVLEDEIDLMYAGVPMVGAHEQMPAIEGGSSVNVIQGEVIDDEDVQF